MGEQLENDLYQKKERNNEVEDNGLIGLSLSLCISDILRGKVRESQVKEIITSTKAEDREEFEKLLESYKINCWSGIAGKKTDSEEGAAIARRLYESGKIRQPRLDGEATLNISQGHWLEAKTAEEEHKERLE